MSPLLREVIEIPEAVHKGDFVMSLASGVENRHATLADYVVTEQLVVAYDNALGFIASAIRDRTSKAAYLDGSFGSGKSHFMAVLHLLLQGDPEARAIADLAPVIAKYDPVLADKSFALVPFHLIGKESMEEAIFGGYVEHLAQVDPSAPPPGVYADAPLFEQADLTRKDLGDAEFFARLNGGGGTGGGSDDVDSGWGELAAAWDAERYVRAKAAAVADPDRRRLGGAIVATVVPGFREAMRGNPTGYVDLDTGLAELARHASARGSDALILFLDELILWLGSRIADPAFVAREGQKLIKLIEFTTPRPIPVISLVARQRDLREFVGDQIPGIEKLSFADALRHWNDRFHRISLEDRNLPKIAERRLLRPRDESAKQAIDAAFRETERARPEVLDVLMTEDGDRAEFRATYPFSPAFMKALIAASQALQRDRTALRVMLQLLVDRREQLELGDLVGVGDLFDVLGHGDEPFAEEMKRHFEHAKEVYRDQFHPLLVEESPNGVDPLLADERLVKTLLLAALVPQAAPLRNLDVAKLTALNHGSIASPIPGQERKIVLGKLRKWSGRVGALKVGEDLQNPSVEVRLTGVDVDSIIARADSVDSAGERRRVVKHLVLGELGIEADTQLFVDHSVIWRGTRRTVDVAFGNVRDTVDLPDDNLRATGERWRLVVDYPFDPGHTPNEDLDRLERWRHDHGASRTVCWIPAFFSQSLQRDLKRLVIVRHVLADQRLEQYADHLSPQDRQQARGILGDLRSALEQRVKTAIRQAYGVERALPDTIDGSHGVEERLQSLWSGFSPQVPIGAQLSDALGGLVEQMLVNQFPVHPEFETEVKARELRIVLEEVQRAVDSRDGRIEVPSDRRKVMRQVATPLQLGVQHEAPFVLGTHWKDHLDKAIARAAQGGASSITVGDVRQSIEEPHALGLPRDVQSLIVLVYAAQTGRSFRLHGGPVLPTVDRLDDGLELVTIDLPSERSWRLAADRAGAILGLTSVNPARNATSFERLVADLCERGAALLPAAEQLLPLLERRLSELDAEPARAMRLSTAVIARDLVAGLRSGVDGVTLIERFAGTHLPTSEQAIGTSLTSAAGVVAALEDPRWEMLGVVGERARSGEEAHRRIVEELAQVLERDEFAAPIVPAVERAASEGVKLLRVAAAPSERDPRPAAPPAGTDHGGAAQRLDLVAARRKLDELEKAEGRVVVDLAWTITNGRGTS